MYIFAALEISLLYLSVVGIYRGGMVWGCGVTDSKGPTNILLDSGRVVI